MVVNKNIHVVVVVFDMDTYVTRLVNHTQRENAHNSLRER